MLRASLLALSMVSAFSMSAAADGLKAEQVVEVATVTLDENGEEVRAYSAASEVAPGDEVRYSLVYENAGDAPAEAVSLVMPVPSEVTYIELSAGGTPSAITYSADGGTTFAARDSLILGQGEAARIASAEEITHIKWAFAEPIPAAAAGAIEFRAVLK